MARAGEAGRAGAHRPAGPSRAAGGARAAADAARAELRRRLEPGLAVAGFDLEDVTVTRAGSRSVVRVVVDREGGIDLDAVADASRLVSAVLDDDEDAPGAAPVGGAYVLEVTSPGVDRPLTSSRHWRRAVGRLVLVRRADGTEVEGRVLSADEEGADLAVPTGPARRGRPVRRRVERIGYTTVARAVVQVEFGATDDDDAVGEETADTDAVGAGDLSGVEGTADGEDADDEDAAEVDGPGETDEVTGADVSAQAENVAGAGGAAGSEQGRAAVTGDPAVEDHDAVGAKAGRSGRTGKEMNR